MAEASPELYLSLLSGQDRSDEYRDNHIGTHLSSLKFPKDPHRLFDILDALAAICVSQDKGDVFFVALSMKTSATLYVATNGTVQTRVVDYLHRVHGQLNELKLVLEHGSPPPNIEYPDSNNTDLRNEGERKIQKTIYEHTYLKVRKRFNKRGPEILFHYDRITKDLEAKNDPEDIEILHLTHEALSNIGNCLLDETPHEATVTDLIQELDALSAAWRPALDAGRDEGGKKDEVKEVKKFEDLLTRWDDLTVVKEDRRLSLRRFLQKMLTLHQHIRRILRIARSKRLSPFLAEGFAVVPVPATPGKLSVQFSQQKVLSIAFPHARETMDDAKKAIYDELMHRLMSKADSETIKIESKKAKGPLELLVPKTDVHAECRLLSYNVQNPDIDSYPYFGGSKLSCHGCATFFKAYNAVSGSFNQYFTKGSHDKIYLRWLYPSLLSPEEPIRGATSLDVKVQEEMKKILGGELAVYASELQQRAGEASSAELDSTDGSGDSREAEVADLTLLRAMHGLRQASI